MLTARAECGHVISLTNHVGFLITAAVLYALPNTMPRVKHWDSQKALALHFLLVKVRREETVSIGRYDGFYWSHAFRGGLRVY